MNQKLETMLQLALQTSEEVREQTEELNVGFKESTRTWELIVKYHGNLDKLAALGIGVEYLIAGYAVLTVPELLVERMVELEEIEYVEKPKRYFYERDMPAYTSCIVQVSLRDPYLTGAGVLVAVLDSGIDYKRPEFRKRDGSTRIRYLWDQTLQPEIDFQDPAERMEGGLQPETEGGLEGAGGAETTEPVEEAGGRLEGAAAMDAEAGAERRNRRPPAGFQTGVEFDSEQINQALAQTNPQRQFELLPSLDNSGHGTAVAGIAAGSSSSYQGAAQEAELLIVKLGQPDEGSFPRTTEVMRAVTYAVRKAVEMQMPVVVNLSFGNTYGAHDGSSLLERFIDNA